MKQVIAFLLAVWLAFPCVALASQWPEAARAVMEEAGEARALAQTSMRDMRAERERLRAEAAAMRKRVKALERAYEERRREYESLRDKESALRTDLGAEEKELELVEGVVRSVARDAVRLLEGKAPAPDAVDRDEVLDRLMEDGGGFGGVRALTQTLFAAMDQAGRAEVTTETFVDGQGRKRSGEVGRLGWFGIVYPGDGGAGYLRWDPVLGCLAAVPGETPGDAASLAAEWLEGQGALAPLDMSGGAVFEGFADGRGVTGWLRAGGVLVWPILLAGAVALLLALERLVVLLRMKHSGNGLVPALQILLAEHGEGACREHCKTLSGSPACRVLLAGLNYRGAPRDVLENAFHEAILKEISRLERFLPTLGVLGAVAPLLGLLGTVTGMITTFRTITAFGTGNPAIMSGGISEALITTQLGLAVAVPIVLAHHFLERRVEAVVGDMEEKSVAFTVALLEDGRRNGHG